MIVEGLNKLGIELLEDAYRAFEKFYGYDPREYNDRLEFKGVKEYTDDTNNYFYAFKYLEKTPHDCPDMIELHYPKKEVVELAEIENIRITCDMCENLNKVMVMGWSNVQLDTAMYLQRHGITCDNDEYGYHVKIKWNYCPECGTKVKKK